MLIILAGMWAVFLGAPYLRNRSERHGDSILSFRQHLSTLERTRPGVRSFSPGAKGPMTVQPIAMRTSPMPSGRAEARRRRRDILFTLAGAVVITLLLAVLLGGVAVLFHLAADAILGLYVFMLVQMRKTEAEKLAKVRYLPTKADTVEPVYLRSASN